MAAVDPALLWSIVDGMEDAVYAKDRRGRYVFANPAAVRVLVGSRGELVGRDDTALFSPADVERIRRMDVEVMETARAHSHEEELQLSGRARVFLTTKTPYRAEDGRVIGLIGISRDITERIAEHRGLEESTAHLEELTAELELTVDQLQARTAEAEAARTAAEQAEERARILDHAGRLLHSSLDYEMTLRAVARLLVPEFADWCTIHLADEGGEVRRLEIAHVDPAMLEVVARMEERYPPDPHRAQGVHEVMRTGTPVLYPEITEDVVRAAAQDEQHAEMLVGLQLRSAIIVPMQVSDRTLGAITLITSTSGRSYTPEDLRLVEELARRASIAMDHAQLYLQSQAANRAKSEFLATMSHELRTPLNAITGYADLLQLGVGDQSQRIAHLERIKASAYHLLTVIEEILTFSRIEADREVVRVEPVDVTELAAEAALMIEPLARQKGLRFEVALDTTPSTVIVDRSKALQILLNLLGNAVKFTERGEVVLEGSRVGSEVLLRVRDTGPGIEAAHLERIFEPFWQLDRGIRRRSGGTGLGLTVSRQLAELMGGSLAVTSETGQGSVFTLRLPATERE